MRTGNENGAPTVFRVVGFAPLELRDRLAGLLPAGSLDGSYCREGTWYLVFASLEDRLTGVEMLNEWGYHVVLVTANIHEPVPHGVAA